MEPFTLLRGKAVPMPRANINTDDIISAQAMAGKVENIGEKLFTGARYDLNGAKRPDFILNTPRYDGSRIVLGGANFGCGSSREAVVWALTGYGIRCVIAPSFGEIFHDNSFQNGLLPLVLEESLVRTIIASVERAAEPVMSVDLMRERIVPPDGPELPFSIPAERRAALLSGQDELDILLEHLGDLDRYRTTAPRRLWPAHG